MPAQLFCNLEINYAEVPGSALPFRVALDLSNSNLTPGPGENQKFCYILTGVGSDDPDLIDLSHWVLGICEDITAAQIVQDTITVVIDEEPQTVIFGDNVVLVTPDPTTGCSGLKFEFPLNKVGGVMNVCFELNTPYPVGPTQVCLKGGQEAETGLSICGPVCQESQFCETVTYQPATVCVPVTVTPFVIPGPTRTICCGDPLILPGATSCPAGARSCFFTVTQRMCVEVPIAFGASTTPGVPQVVCEEASEEFCPEC